MFRKAIKAVLVGLVGVCALVSAAAIAKEEMPEVTTDGLVLMKDSEVRVAYVKPGATLDPYTKVALLDCYVAFKKNWDRDYNRDHMGGRVTAKDMEKIKEGLAEEFKKVFTEQLQEKGGYEIVDEAGDDVLIVRPAIVNLDITAPDIRTTSMTRTVVASAGQMTLYMELFDSSTGDIIARVIDPQADNRGGYGMRATRGSNKAAADRIIREWAETLRSHLGDLGEATEAQ